MGAAGSKVVIEAQQKHVMSNNQAEALTFGLSQLYRLALISAKASRQINLTILSMTRFNELWSISSQQSR